MCLLISKMYLTGRLLGGDVLVYYKSLLAK